MSDVISFIERLGQDSELRYGTRETFERALASEPISPELRAALASGDRHQLETLLRASSNVCCVVFVPVETAEEDEPAKKAA